MTIQQHNIQGTLRLSASLLLALLLPSCRTGHSINLTVEVPPDVQLAFSSSRPGLILQGDIVVGRLCQPSAENQLISTVFVDSHLDCETLRANHDAIYGTAFAFSPATFKIMYSPADAESAIACGTTGSVLSKSGYFVRPTDIAPDLTEADKVAVASGAGQCLGENHYQLSLTLALR